MNHSDVDRSFRPDAGMGLGVPSPSGTSQDLGDTQVLREKFEEAVREFAQWSRLDADSLLRGERFEMSGAQFELLYYGPRDPAGVTVVIDYGAIPAYGEAVSYREMLTHNVMTPAGRSGFFALSPEDSRVLLCFRVDLVQEGGGATGIGNVVGTAAEAIRTFQQALIQQAQAIAREADAAAVPTA